MSETPGFGRTAATGLLLDAKIRRAALAAVPPLTRLAALLARRYIRQQASARLQATRDRRLVPAALAAGLLAGAVIVASNPTHRQRIQRLVVH